MKIKTVLRKTGKYLLFFLIGIIGLILVGLLALYLKSPGEPEAFYDENGKPIESSISTIEKIELGGLEQYLIIRGIDANKPVLLFLHGGPGTPVISFVKKHNPELEKDFVVVYWEQRGAGKSYNNTIPIESMNLTQFVEDSKDLSEYLIKRFNKKKIYIMGHSWGSFLGFQVIEKYPELYHAYFGIGQVANQYKSEKMSFDWLKEQALINQDEEVMNELASLHFPKKEDNAQKWMDYLLPERDLVDKYGGGFIRNYPSIWDKLLPVINTPEYTLKDKFSFLSGALFSVEHLWEEVITTNLFAAKDSIQIPIYFFHGIHDRQTVYTVAKEFYDSLKAPKKEFFTFENSAHWPICNEPKKFNEIIRKIIADSENNDEMVSQ